MYLLIELEFNYVQIYVQIQNIDNADMRINMFVN
jgi:hypothetical protein